MDINTMHKLQKNILICINHLMKIQREFFYLVLEPYLEVIKNCLMDVADNIIL